MSLSHDWRLSLWVSDVVLQLSGNVTLVWCLQDTSQNIKLQGLLLYCWLCVVLSKTCLHKFSAETEGSINWVTTTFSLSQIACLKLEDTSSSLSLTDRCIELCHKSVKSLLMSVFLTTQCACWAHVILSQFSHLSLRMQDLICKLCISLVSLWNLRVLRTHQVQGVSVTSDQMQRMNVLKLSHLRLLSSHMCG